MSGTDHIGPGIAIAAGEQLIRHHEKLRHRGSHLLSRSWQPFGHSSQQRHVKQRVLRLLTVRLA